MLVIRAKLVKKGQSSNSFRNRLQPRRGGPEKPGAGGCCLFGFYRYICLCI
jgi:hypothetical protein